MAFWAVCCTVTGMKCLNGVLHYTVVKMVLAWADGH